MKGTHPFIFAKGTRPFSKKGQSPLRQSAQR